MSEPNVLTPPFRVDGGWLSLDTPLHGLSETIHFRDREMLVKSEFHTSLVSIKGLVAKHGFEEEKVTNAAAELLKQCPVKFGGFRNELRYVTRDDRRTVVIMCNVEGLVELTKALGEKLGVAIPAQPTHVTIYTLGLDKGIGLTSQADVDTMTIPITDGELDELKTQMNFQEAFGDVR